MATKVRQIAPGSAQYWTLALASVASFIVVLDLLVVATALSTIRRALGASIEQLEWTVNAYTLTFAVLLMTAAALGDRFGRRRLFAAGLGLFAAASAACALAPSVGWLIAARAVQGAGAAMVMPLALALLNAAFPPQRRGWAMGIFGGVTGLAALVGPCWAARSPRGSPGSGSSGSTFRPACSPSRWSSSASRRATARDQGRQLTGMGSAAAGGVHLTVGPARCRRTPAGRAGAAGTRRSGQTGSGTGRRWTSGARFRR
jgi:hypothetical protein